MRQAVTGALRATKCSPPPPLAWHSPSYPLTLCGSRRLSWPSRLPRSCRPSKGQDQGPVNSCHPSRKGVPDIRTVPKQAAQPAHGMTPYGSATGAWCGVRFLHGPTFGPHSNVLRSSVLLGKLPYDPCLVDRRISHSGLDFAGLLPSKVRRPFGWEIRQPGCPGPAVHAQHGAKGTQAASYDPYNGGESCFSP